MTRNSMPEAAGNDGGRAVRLERYAHPAPSFYSTVEHK